MQASPPARLLRQALLYGAGLLLAAWSLAPFLWQLSTSFQEDKALVAQVPTLIPAPPILEHYVNIFTEKAFHRYLVNSAIVAGSATLLCLFLGALAAFALSRYPWRGRFATLAVILSVSMFPQIAIVGPLYLIAADLGLLDGYAVLVLVYLALGLPLVIWVLFGYFQSIPKELDEAAVIDGAGPLRLFFGIILPVARPGLVTTGLLAFIAAWNEFMFALAFTSSIDHQTIPVGIANFSSLYYVPWGDIAAASVVVTLPLVLIVAIFERHLISGLTQGALRE
jgi:multiple sugar transport system permease protein/trehalose/maltose transport system permease protein